MITIKYIVDRGFRRAGEVRSEEDGVAENLILRGFAERTDETPDAGTGDGQAVTQYNPEGTVAETPASDTVEPDPAETDATEKTGINTPTAETDATEKTGS